MKKNIIALILCGAMIVGALKGSDNFSELVTQTLLATKTQGTEGIQEEKLETSSEAVAHRSLLAPPRREEPSEPESDMPAYTVEELTATMYANTDSNIRKGPSTDYEVIGGACTNTELKITGLCSTGWYRIEFKGGEGFISGRLVSDTPVVIQEPETTNEPEKTSEPETSIEPEAASEPEKPAETVTEPETVVEPEPAPAPTRCPIATNPAPSANEQAIINNILAQIVSPEMSDWDVAVAINNYLCAIAEYDQSYSNYSAMSLFSSGYGVCQAYANAYWRLMNAAGIPTDYVSGTAFNGVQSGRHGWNRVLIGGNYYYVDVTWNDTTYNSYLLVDYSTISRDHFEERYNPYREY